MITRSINTSSSPGSNPLNFINSSNVASIEVLKDASATAIDGARAAYGVIIIKALDMLLKERYRELWFECWGASGHDTLSKHS